MCLLCWLFLVGSVACKCYFCSIIFSCRCKKEFIVLLIHKTEITFLDELKNCIFSCTVGNVRRTCVLAARCRPLQQNANFQQRHVDDEINMRPNRETEIWTVKALWQKLNSSVKKYPSKKSSTQCYVLEVHTGSFKRGGKCRWSTVYLDLIPLRVQHCIW